MIDKIAEINDIVGKKLEDAQEFAKTKSLTIRVVQKDGKHLIITSDYRSNRVNVAIFNNKIANIVSVG